VQGSWRTPDALWICMEYCAGGSVSDIMHTCGGGLDEDMISYICAQTLAGLAYLHTMGKVGAVDGSGGCRDGPRGRQAGVGWAPCKQACCMGPGEKLATATAVDVPAACPALNALPCPPSPPHLPTYLCACRSTAISSAATSCSQRAAR
jgi:hypothetical protein